MSADPQEIFASVITPTRDRAHLLRRAIESVISQDSSDWELLVVDDGDGEGVDAAAAFRDPRVRAVANAGTGLVDARNTGLVHARGRLVCWLDDDDWWCDSGHLSLLRHRSAKETGFAYRSGWIVFEDGDGSVEVSREIFDHAATAESLLKNNTVLTSSLAYPREAHRQLGLLDRELGGYCDWDFILRLCAAGLPPYKLDGLGICYSIHGTNVSSAYDAPARRLGFERFAAKHGLEIELANHLRIHRALEQPETAEA